MNQPLADISLAQLSIAFIPVIMALAVLYFWQINVKRASYALVRMLSQLLLIGYFLNYLFTAQSSLIILAILIFMVIISSWIALSNTQKKSLNLFKQLFIAIGSAGGFTLIVITQGVLTLTPWYQPQVVIPLAGMLFANCMNSVSLCSERYFSEVETSKTYLQCRQNALKAATMPVLNSLFAVGIVALPGMMTGQILSGITPLIAVRYQIIVMCMIFASSILSASCFLLLVEKKYRK
jgi:putative ABC transport system permease protein